MWDIFVNSIRGFNELLSAGVAISAFSLLLYALSFNLRDRVARTFAFILICVVIVFVGDTISVTAASPQEMEFWLRLQWVGIIFLPASYLNFSDALLATTGRPSRGRRRLFIRLSYLVAIFFLISLLSGHLVGPLVQNIEPAPHLERTPLTWGFTFLYALGMIFSWINFLRAYRRTVTSTSRRRMQYLVLGSLAPALGSYPYLLFGSGLAEGRSLLFWLLAVLSNLFVLGLLVLMAYAVAFFGVPWPDRVVKRRLFKWLMRGPVTAILVLGLTTLIRRAGGVVGFSTAALVPIAMVASMLVFQHIITLAAPVWERRLFHGGDRSNMELMQTLEERLLTSGDLHQFLEAILAAVCDRLQISKAFIASLNSQGLEMIVTQGVEDFRMEEFPNEMLKAVDSREIGTDLFTWGSYWIVPLFDQRENGSRLIGLIGVVHGSNQAPDEEQREALALLSERAGLALEDRSLQQQVFSSLEDLTPQMDMIQRMRAAGAFDRSQVLAPAAALSEYRNVSRWVKDALSHYWGGPKLTQSPLLRMKVVQKALADHEGNPANALRSILNQAIDQTRPEGERRFTGEWILYNILEMKFMEGRKVRDIAVRLAMSEADLYRKQRVAIEAVAAAIVEMEQKEREDIIPDSSSPDQNPEVNL
jgi:MFS family permease